MRDIRACNDSLGTRVMVFQRGKNVIILVLMISPPTPTLLSLLSSRLVHLETTHSKSMRFYGCSSHNACICPSIYKWGNWCLITVTCEVHCLNGGRCTSPEECECPVGYTGDRCQTGMNIV